MLCKQGSKNSSILKIEDHFTKKYVIYEVNKRKIEWLVIGTYQLQSFRVQSSIIIDKLVIIFTCLLLSLFVL